VHGAARDRGRDRVWPPSEKPVQGRFPSLADNRNLKLFSQLNELYGSASTVHLASYDHTLAGLTEDAAVVVTTARHGPKHPTASLVANIEDVEMRAFETADQAAESAAAMLADGEQLSRLWRYVFAQMLDDYTSVLRHAGVAAAARMWSDAPRGTGDTRVDAAFAAMAEYLARRDGWIVPAWARLPEREAWPWWFVTDLRGLHPQALVESPSSFRRRGVFITSGALDRA
jgi:hypothetical protein